jgi:hypothetical protein
MERRNWSLKALSELNYIDSLDKKDKTPALFKWAEKHLIENKIEDFDLELSDLQRLEELFFKNINFLKQDKIDTQKEIKEIQKIQKFLNH